MRVRVASRRPEQGRARDRFLVGALAALTILPAALIGSVHPPVQVGILAAVALLLALMALWRPGRSRAVLPTTLRWALAIGVAASFIQLIPLPIAVVRLLSPTTASLRALTAEGALSWLPLSLAPPATVLALANHIACVGALVLGACLLRRRERLGAVAWTLAGGGVVLALVGLVQRAVGSRRILGLYRPDWWSGFLATFVNTNHAAAFFLLVIGALVGLAASARGRARAVALVALAPVVGILLLSTSRGGLAGLLVLMLAFALPLAGRTGDRRAAIGITAMLAVITIAGFMVAYPALESRLAELYRHPVHNSKLLAWADAAAMTLHFPWTGVGRGAFVDVLPHFARFNHDVTVTHVEDLPLQAAADWGIPVAGILIVLVGATIVQLGRRRLDPLERGLHAAVVALLFQNLFDFNLEFPGTAIPCCVLVGALCARVARRHDPAAPPTAKRTGWQPPAWALAAGAAVGAVFAGRAAAHTLRLADRAITQAKGPPQDVAATVHATLEHHPVDAHLHELGARALLRAGDPHGMHHLNLAMTLAPRSNAPHLQAARALAAADRRPQAALEYRTALELGAPPNDLLLGEILARCGAAEGLGAMPDDELKLHFAGFLERQGKREDARQAFERLAKIDLLMPRTPATLVAALRGVLRLNPRDPVGVAMELARRAGAGADVAQAIGTLRASGHADLADRTVIAALERFPTAPEVVLPAAQALQREGALTSAAQALDRLLASGPDHATRRAALAQLERLQEEQGRFTDAHASRILLQQLTQ